MQRPSAVLRHGLCSILSSALPERCAASIISLSSFTPSRNVHASPQRQADGLGSITSGPVDIFDR